MDFLKYEPKDCKEAFGILNNRQVVALMFHNESAELFHFLGLEGFKALHEYQFIEESVAHLKMKNYYLSNKGVLLPDGEVDSLDVIPDEWLKYSRWDVTPSVRDQAIQKAMDQYCDWEKETKAIYEKYIAYFLAWKQVSDAQYISCLLEDVNEELNCLNSLVLSLRGISYDPVQVMALQPQIKAKYEERLEDLRIHF